MQLTQIIDAISQLDNAQFVELAAQLDTQRQKRAQQILAEANAAAAMLTGGETKKSSSRRKLPPKYLNKKTGETWSGQGRQPLWFREYLAKGGTESELRV